MVEGRNDSEAALGSEPLGDLLPVLVARVVGDDLGAVATLRIELYLGRISRHDDGGRHAKELAGERHRLRVIPGGECDDAPSLLLGRELRQRVVGAAELE